jgi:uncharacterized membrane protein
MSRETLDWIYVTSTLTVVVSLLSIIQLIVVTWIFKTLIGKDELPRLRKAFNKFKHWAYALLFTTVVASVGALLMCLTYFKTHGMIQ